MIFAWFVYLRRFLKRLPWIFKLNFGKIHEIRIKNWIILEKQGGRGKKCLNCLKTARCSVVYMYDGTKCKRQMTNESSKFDYSKAGENATMLKLSRTRYLRGMTMEWLFWMGLWTHMSLGVFKVANFCK